MRANQEQLRRRLPAAFAAPVAAAAAFALALWLLPRAAHAQSTSGITAPLPGDTLTGVVVVAGTALHPDFLRYELAFLNQSVGSGDWIVFAQGDQPVIDGTLAVWDTTVGLPTNPVFPDGLYQMRLRVVRTDYNYDEYFVRDLLIANVTGTPTPTATLTTTATAAVPATVAVGTPVLPGDTGVLPTLTPFPTFTPQPTVPAAEAANQGDSGSGEVEPETRGLLARLSAIDLGHFGRAFALGARIGAYAFVALGLYLMLRATARWLWRTLQNRR